MAGSCCMAVHFRSRADKFCRLARRTWRIGLLPPFEAVMDQIRDRAPPPASGSGRVWVWVYTLVSHESLAACGSSALYPYEIFLHEGTNLPATRDRRRRSTRITQRYNPTPPHKQLHATHPRCWIISSSTFSQRTTFFALERNLPHGSRYSLIRFQLKSALNRQRYNCYQRTGTLCRLHLELKSFPYTSYETFSAFTLSTHFRLHFFSNSLRSIFRHLHVLMLPAVRYAEPQ